MSKAIDSSTACSTSAVASRTCEPGHGGQRRNVYPGVEINAEEATMPIPMAVPVVNRSDPRDAACPG